MTLTLNGAVSEAMLILKDAADLRIRNFRILPRLQPQLCGRPEAREAARRLDSRAMASAASAVEACQYVRIDTLLLRNYALEAMRTPSRISQLQIRVSEAQKSAIRRAAERAGMDMSAYVLSRVLAAPAREFQEAAKKLNGPAAPAFALADINALLSRLSTSELSNSVAAAPEAKLSPFLANYVAAMVEAACQKRGIPLPAWTREIAALIEPVFGSELQSLRLHLLTHSPAAFRRRNIFIDASLGDQV